MTFTVIVLGRNDLRRLIHRIEHWDSTRNILNECDGPVMTVGRIVAAKAKANVLVTPSKKQNAKRGRPSLRRAIAHSIVIKKSHARDAVVVSIFSNPSKMPPGKKGLASLYEGVSEWHHPVYGHEPIVTQAAHPYMRDQGAQSAMHVAGEKVLFTIARHIG